MNYMLLTRNFAYSHGQILVAFLSASMHPWHTFDPMHFAINQATRSSSQGKFHSWITIIQVGRDFVRSGVQSLAEVSVSNEVIPGCLWLCPVGSAKPPRTVLSSFLMRHLNCNVNNILLINSKCNSLCPKKRKMSF